MSSALIIRRISYRLRTSGVRTLYKKGFGPNLTQYRRRNTREDVEEALAIRSEEANLHFPPTPLGNHLQPFTEILLLRTIKNPNFGRRRKITDIFSRTVRQRDISSSVTLF
jgi:hypothetical protein